MFKLFLNVVIVFLIFLVEVACVNCMERICDMMYSRQCSQHFLVLSAFLFTIVRSP